MTKAGRHRVRVAVESALRQTLLDEGSSREILEAKGDMAMSAHEGSQTIEDRLDSDDELSVLHRFDWLKLPEWWDE